MASEPKPRRRVDNRAIVRLVVLALLVLYALVFVLMNRDDVEVSFVFFSAEISLLVLILLCVGLGFAAGYLFDELRTRRRSQA